MFSCFKHIIQCKMDLYYFVKVIFVAYNVFRMVFWSGIFGGGHYNHSDPYLYSTIILFDTV